MTPELLAALNEARASGRPTCLVRDLDGDRASLVVDGGVTAGEPLSEAALDAVRRALRDDRSGLAAGGPGRLFVQVFNPPLRLAIVGAVHIAQALAPMARLLGYGVTIVDPRGAFATEARFADMALVDEWPDEALQALRLDRRSAVVTLTHDPKLDDPALDEALKSDAFYIAALGSRRTHAARLERLRAAGHDEAALSRIRGPAGLAIGAISPAEIAISAMAEMTAVLRGADR